MINIIDYEMGNLRSVEKAFEKLGFAARVSALPLPDRLGTPDILLMVSEEVLVFDNLAGTIRLVVNADPGLDNALELANERLRALVARLRSVVEQATKAFEAFDYAAALQKAKMEVPTSLIDSEVDALSKQEAGADAGVDRSQFEEEARRRRELEAERQRAQEQPRPAARLRLLRLRPRNHAAVSPVGPGMATHTATLLAAARPPILPVRRTNGCGSARRSKVVTWSAPLSRPWPTWRAMAIWRSSSGRPCWIM